ncbi:MAG: hypothetical protein C4534_09085 [Gaiellales bacterium]|nr:MAG: hypothetical protein C4534_09085 [Gaiellales bacterium]
MNIGFGFRLFVLPLLAVFLVATLADQPSSEPTSWQLALEEDEWDPEDHKSCELPDGADPLLPVQIHHGAPAVVALAVAHPAEHIPSALFIRRLSVPRAPPFA